MKKENLNNALLRVHIKATQEWGKASYPIKDSINETINKELERKYKTMAEKLKKFSNTQKDGPDNMKKFYPRATNKTNIVFSKDELLLLNKGLKYNFCYKHKNWIRTSALEAERRQLLINYPY